MTERHCVFIWDRKFEWEGDYEIRLAVPYLVDGRTDPCDIEVSLDGAAPQRFKPPIEFIEEGRFTDLRLHLPAGTHQIKAWLDWDMNASFEIAWKKEGERQKKLADLASGKAPAKGGGGFVDRRPPMTRAEVEERVKSLPPYVEFAEVRRPLQSQASAPLPDGYRRVYSLVGTRRENTPSNVCARISRASRAGRGASPAAPAEVCKASVLRSAPRCPKRAA